MLQTEITGHIIYRTKIAPSPYCSEIDNMMCRVVSYVTMSFR